MDCYGAAEQFISALASAEPTPGGGAAAAHAGAMGCALLLMAAGTTLKRKNISQEVRAKLEQHIKLLTSLKNELNAYVTKDGEAYAGYMTARKLPADHPQRQSALQDALLYAARVPASTATTAVHVLKELELIKGDIAEIIYSDVLCAKHLLQACIRCAVENIRANLVFIQHADRKAELEKQITTFLKSC